MPMAGGAAGKFGDRYEVRWAVACALDVLNEHALSIRLEPPGQLGEKVEFFLRTPWGIEFHQVKRQQTGQAGWSIGQLAREGVLSGFLDKLKRSEVASCVFVSSQPAVVLSELIERANSATSAEEFEIEFVNSNKLYSAEFFKLRQAWEDCSVECAHGLLKRMTVRTLDEQGIRELVAARLTPLVQGQVDEVGACLFEFMFDSIHRDLTAAEIWHRIEGAGFRRRRWANDPHVLAAVTSITDRYITRLERQLIGGSLISRTEAVASADSLTTNSDRPAIMVTGPAGQGKSAVVLETIAELRHRGVLVLAIRLDELHPTLDPDELGRQLGLPGSPAAVLAATSRGTPAVLVIDQLDAISLVSGRNVQFFDCIDDLIGESQHLGLALLLACRKFDIENDYRIRC